MKTASKQVARDVKLQQAALLNWSKTNQVGISEMIVERYYDPRTPFAKRSEGRRLFGRMGPGDILVAERFARLFGAPEDGHSTLLELGTRGCHVRCCDMGGGDKDIESSEMLLIALLAVCANTAYADSLSRKATKKRESETGRYRGGHKQFGWHIANGGKLRANQDEQRHITQLARMRNAGATYKSLEGFSIAEGFNLTGPGIWKILARHANKDLL